MVTDPPHFPPTANQRAFHVVVLLAICSGLSFVLLAWRRACDAAPVPRSLDCLAFLLWSGQVTWLTCAASWSLVFVAGASGILVDQVRTVGRGYTSLELARLPRTTPRPAWSLHRLLQFYAPHAVAARLWLALRGPPAQYIGFSDNLVVI